MRKIIFIISLLLAFPLIASAHTTVTSSNPSEGDVITGRLDELTIEFAGEIENQGTLILVRETEQVEINTISIQEKKITGTLETPLGNGEYNLTWKVASKDGHVLTGDIPFTVNTPATSKEESTKEEVQAGETEKNIEKENKSSAPESKTETVKDNNSIISTISVIVLVILLAFGIWILLCKKR